MDCPRCNNKVQNIVEYFTDDKEFLYYKEYYCTKCKSSVIETYDKSGLKRIRMD